MFTYSADPIIPLFALQVITGSEITTSQPAPPLQPAALAVAPAPEPLAQTLPRRKRPGQLHLRSCGDLSTFTWADLQLGVGTGGRRPGSRSASSRLGSRMGSSRLGEQDRPHSLIGVFRETVLWPRGATTWNLPEPNPNPKATHPKASLDVSPFTPCPSPVASQPQDSFVLKDSYLRRHVSSGDNLRILNFFLFLLKFD